MSDTPETDAHTICSNKTSFKPYGGVVVVPIARKLERERNLWRKCAEQLAAIVEDQTAEDDCLEEKDLFERLKAYANMFE